MILNFELTDNYKLPVSNSLNRYVLKFNLYLKLMLSLVTLFYKKNWTWGEN